MKTFREFFMCLYTFYNIQLKFIFSNYFCYGKGIKTNFFASSINA